MYLFIDKNRAAEIVSLRAYPAWMDPGFDGEAFFVSDEGGGDGSCGQRRRVADSGLAVGADGAVAAGAAVAPVGLSSSAGAEPGRDRRDPAGAQDGDAVERAQRDPGSAPRRRRTGASRSGSARVCSTGSGG